MSGELFQQVITKWKVTADAADSTDARVAYARCAYELEDVLDRLGILPLPEGDPRR